MYSINSNNNLFTYLFIHDYVKPNTFYDVYSKTKDLVCNLTGIFHEIGYAVEDVVIEVASMSKTSTLYTKSFLSPLS